MAWRGGWIGMWRGGIESMTSAPVIVRSRSTTAMAAIEKLDEYLSTSSHGIGANSMGYRIDTPSPPPRRNRR